MNASAELQSAPAHPEPAAAGLPEQLPAPRRVAPPLLDLSAAHGLVHAQATFRHKASGRPWTCFFAGASAAASAVLAAAAADACLRGLVTRRLLVLRWSGGMYTLRGASAEPPLWHMLAFPCVVLLLVVQAVDDAARGPRGGDTTAPGGMASDAACLMDAPPSGDGDVALFLWDVDTLAEHRVSESPSAPAPELQKYSE